MRKSHWLGLVAAVAVLLLAEGVAQAQAFDSRGALETQQCTLEGRYPEITRDTLHRVTRVDYLAVGAWAAISVTTQYDEFGRVEQTSDATGTSTFLYDHLNRVTRAVPAVGQGATYTYSPDPIFKRWITGVTLDTVGTWQFGEDGKGREAQVLNPFGQLTQRRFDPDGKAIQELRANGTLTNYSYTDRDWLAGIEHRTATGALLDSFAYSYTDGLGSYDGTGRIRQETDSLGQAHKFVYSQEHYELQREDHPDFTTRQYFQDGHGNHYRKQQGTTNVYYGFDAHNKLLWVNQGMNAAPTSGQANPYRLYTYNGNGEPTQIERRDATGSPVVTDTLEWDGMGKLRKVVSGGTTVYTASYDGAGDRVQAVLNGTTHTYSYGAGLLHDSAGTTVSTPGVSHRQNGVDSYYHADWIGSTRYTTDATGLTAPAAQRWDAYGNLTASAGGHGGALRWVGGHGYEADGPLGMSLLGARYYDPAVGRFLNADPIGIAGGINQFNYCGGDPVNAVDPSGLITQLETEAAKATARAAVSVGAAESGAIASSGAAAVATTGGAAAGRIWLNAVPVAGQLLSIGVSTFELTRYVQTGKPQGGFTSLGHYLGGQLGSVLFPQEITSEAWQKAFLGRTRCGSGEEHHVLSNRIMRALQAHPTLGGVFNREDPRFLVRAVNKQAHRGYEHWHINIDDRMVDWINSDPTHTPGQFLSRLRQEYMQPHVRWRFPKYAVPNKP